MRKKRGSGSPKRLKSGRMDLDARSPSFIDNLSDDERQSLLQERALSRKLSYKPEAISLPPEEQIEYLRRSASGRDWGAFVDFLLQLLGNEKEDPLNTKEFTEILRWAAEDGDDRVVRLLTEHNLVDVQLPLYYDAFLIAAELGHAAVVKQLLKHCKKVHRNSPRDFHEFVNARDSRSSALYNSALHWACDKGHIAVVKELLEDYVLGELDLNVVNGDGDTPLHVAITRALKTWNLDLIDMLCTKGKQKKLLMCKKDRSGKTPYQRVWEISMGLTTPMERDEVRDTAELMKQMFLKQKPVNDRRDEFYRERDFLQNVATSLLVGATLLVSLTFGGFLQMPKLPLEEDFLEPGSTVFDPNSDLGSRKYWYIRAIDIFRCANAISFFLSIISIIASIRVMISRRDRLFIENEVLDLERSIRVGSIALTLATSVAIVAFISCGLANIPVAESGWSRVVSHWGMREYMPLIKSTTLTTCLLGSMFVAPIVALPLVKDYYFFLQEYRRDMRSIQRFLTLLFATSLIGVVLFMVVMVIFGMGLL